VPEPVRHLIGQPLTVSIWVAWRARGAKTWRYLTFSGGRIVEGGTTRTPKRLRRVAAECDATATPDSLWDVAAYDRLRVLSTELAREAEAGAKVLVVRD
jgi:hypothetical protein